VKKWTKELYVPIHQVDHLSLDSYITKSFARALVLDVGHIILMNLARYAEDVWTWKKNPRKVNAPIQYVQQLVNTNTYDAIVRNKLNIEMAQKQE
jgi:hypothetical protein